MSCRSSIPVPGASPGRRATNSRCRSRRWQLRGLGIGIAIDDFGTGYSSLAYLAKLPAQVLKIDSSFIARMLIDDDAMALVQTILSIATSLRLTTVAEGVESEEQADMLGLLRCAEMQGYFISKPLPREEITPFIIN